jgi:Protein of unknown function (DUF1552)
MPSRYLLGRRQLLRGLVSGTVVGLCAPMLECMLNSHGTAWADGTPLPLRFGVWFFGTGAHGGWAPSSTGPLVLPGGMTPLQRHASNLTLISGLEIATHGDYATNRHHMGAASVLTGAPPRNDATTAASFDQLFAPLLRGGRQKSLEVGIIGGGGSTPVFAAISHAGANAPNVPTQDSRKLYQAIFGATTRPDAGVDDRPARLAYVDAIKGETARLQQRVSAADRARLDNYLAGLREIEIELQGTTAMPVGCVEPGGLASAVAASPTSVNSSAALIARNRLNSKLTALALTCDVTRAFTVYFSSANGADHFPDANTGAELSDNHHELGHQQAADLPRSVEFVMARFADFLDELNAVPEGATTVLANTVVVATTEVSRNHEYSNHPLVLAGRAGGHLKSGLHLRASGPTTRGRRSACWTFAERPRPGWWTSLSRSNGLGPISSPVARCGSTPSSRLSMACQAARPHCSDSRCRARVVERGC